MFRTLRVASIGLVAAIAIAGGCQRRASLTAIVAGGDGPPTLVLLHGYGSSAERWLPFTQTIRWPAHGRFVFPQGPEVMARTDGGEGGRAWWPLDIAAYVPHGATAADLSGSRPAGLTAAAALVRDLLDERRTVAPGPIVLGGFSQGAMVASEVAFDSDTPLSALVILSGTIVDERAWARHLHARRGLPVFLAHGRQDHTLPFEAADRLRGTLEAAGLRVTWFPFDGGHDIPAPVVVALNEFLARLHLSTFAS